MFLDSEDTFTMFVLEGKEVTEMNWDLRKLFIRNFLPSSWDGSFPDKSSSSIFETASNLFIACNFFNSAALAISALQN